MKTTLISLTLSFLLGITSAYKCTPVGTLDLCSIKEKEVNFDIDGVYVNCPGKYTLVCRSPDSGDDVCFSKDPKWRLHAKNTNNCIGYPGKGLIGSYSNRDKAEKRKNELIKRNYSCAVVDQEKRTCLNGSNPCGGGNNPPITGPDPNGHLTEQLGVFTYNGFQKETYYNLDMNGVINIMRNMNFREDCWTYGIRDDGVKTFGGYVMVAANLDVHPRGTFVATSLGTGIVCDTGGFAYSNPNQIDIAVDW